MAQRAFAGVTNALLEQRIAVYRVDPAPAGQSQASPLDVGLDDAFDTSPEPYASSFSFAGFSAQTGGKSLYGRNDLAAELSEAVRLGGSFYTIAYRPAETLEKPADYRRLRVKVDRPGLVATVRQGFYGNSAEGPAGPPASFDEAVRSRVEYTGIALRVASVNGTAVTLRLRSEDLGWQYGERDVRSATLDFAAECFDGKGKQLSYAKGPVEVHQVAADYRGREHAPTEITIPVTFPAGAVRLRVVIADRESGKIGSAEQVPGER